MARYEQHTDLCEEQRLNNEAIQAEAAEREFRRLRREAAREKEFRAQVRASDERSHFSLIDPW